MKFISSIIYQSIMDLFYDQLNEIYVDGNENNIRNIAPADPLFDPSTLKTIVV